ncbi:hypothetical protein [Actinoplanes sichuanensis]|uniref:Uncharacterized protein n=1 Tax=Actinoplanes sichuanensis TaxID=512349 RepID=A0ABW4APU0_9ACTN|nr:hypothetical protein [Actinoplanes sichuanensis]
MRVLALWVLATWCAECVWGGFTVVDYPVVLLFLGPLYGSVAVLIREVARRRGGGWPVMVSLAVAFGLVQAGLVDQSLFDRAALEGTEFAEESRAAGATWVAWPGFSAEQLFEFVRNHVWWSVCAPIAVVEAWAGPVVRREPWLSRRGVVGLVVLYLVASLVNWSDSGRVVTAAQVAVVVVVVVVLVAVALWASPPAGSRRAGSGPAVAAAAVGSVAAGSEGAGSRGPSGVPALVLGGSVLVVEVGSWFAGGGWSGLGLRVAGAVLVAVVAVRWARSQRQVLAVWGAGLVVAAAGAFLAPPYVAAASWLMVVSDVFGLVLVGVLLVVAWRRSRVIGATGGGAVGILAR